MGPRRYALLALGFAFASSCEDSAPSSVVVEPIYVVPTSLSELSGETFFDHPWPSDFRREGGQVRFAGWPNPKSVPILAQYIDFIDGRLDGFSPIASGFMRFDGALDESSLPGPQGDLDAQSTVLLVDVDPTSPDRGERHPIYVTFRAEPGVYWPANTLAFMPVPGLPLRSHTRYALIVTDRVRTATAGLVRASAPLREVLGIDEPTSDASAAARDALAPDIAELAADGVDAAGIVHLAVFTTDDPAEEFLAAAGALPDQVAAPTTDPAAWTLRSEGPSFDEYEGTFGPNPNFQDGTLPFTSFGDGGDFVPDAAGIPQLVDTFDLRFSLSVPKAASCPMPADGYPIVLYAHGTTGDYRSYVSDGTAKSLASQCLATMGVDQIFHGTRPGAPDSDVSKQILFFNFNNVEAARTNARQSGLDEVQRARLFTDTETRVPAAVSVTGADIRFDATKLSFFGHSQGSLNGPLFLAGSAAPRGAVLSGASAVIQITLLEKTQPEPSVATLVKTVFLQLLEGEEAEVGLLYPPLALAQSIVDPVDPVVYARYLVKEPAFGGPKSIYMTEGVRADGSGDSYAPPRGAEALARGVGLPIMTPIVFSPTDGHLTEITIPAGGLAANLANGAASGVFAQWDPGNGEGHFVVFNVDAATSQAAGFLRALADEPTGRVPVP